MERRTLSPGFEVSAIGLGCMGMSEFYGPRDDDSAMKVLSEAVDLGVDFFDTADMYGPHHNESLLGRFLADSGADVKVATKFGIVRNPGEYKRRLDNSPDYARRACEASLKRLGREQIDLYYVHRIEQDRAIEETMEGLANLVRAGKIARIGLCEVSAETLKRAHAVHPVAAVQTEYSLWSRHVEADILPTCRALGVGFVPYSPLGRGFLTGSFQEEAAFKEGDFRASLPRFQDEALTTNRRIAGAVAKMAAEKGCTPAQLSLAWLLSKGDDIVPIPGTKRLEYLRDNVGAVQVRLDAADVSRLESLIEALPVAGARYTAEGMKGVNA
ncbi:aryl-alcohol dehydrogenase-like predicted oxidoreductase [Rhodovulum imhoffii]|uniref:Aryl-alcohol dehydrogenase-like predicted oxidoreductase n=1 Tax=Rhodovulum imhoffii TaxID=365340 RepID=A0A2T5BQA5_9RHOB|nr:aldo/keto reductase [Rhodovulum imhoffii]MBK5933705.1 aldo/keto reductase [Rhodovulum imhoffii]PTN01311.1 aryl-alcohol dehydrogenase-like predicted oxidoreductase [Rhodovulum imhoffii]